MCATLERWPYREATGWIVVIHARDVVDVAASAHVDR
jgi:hypothetical protein